MSKETQKGNAVLVMVAMVLGVLIGLMFSTSHGRQPSGTLSGKMDEVLRLVERHYVDSMDGDSLSEELVRVMLSELDPHSTYLSARETERTEEIMRGNFEGVGIVLQYEGDTVYVGQIIAGGPSEGLGMLPGDMIVSVDGEAVSGVGMPRDSVVARLRGPSRTSVVVEVERLGQRKAFTIHRGVVDYLTVPLCTMLDDTTGYIMLTTFSSTSHMEFRNALRKLNAQGMRHLIFDLRGNSGGALQSAVGIADELLPAGRLIVYTQGAHSRRHNLMSHSGGLFTEGRVTVMVDEGSASASEVVAGALQDNDRALVVGRRTFGKGLVQNEYSLNDGSAVLLTTARYYTPSGRCIQRSYDDGTDEYYRSYVQQLIDETYADSMVVSIQDSTPYYTVGGRTVYGGGGIIPDQLLNYRKDISFVYYNRLASTGLMHVVAFGYVKKHAAELQQRYPDEDAFVRHFEVGEGLIHELVERGKEAGVPDDSKGLRAVHKLIANRMKAYIGQNLYGDGMFYRVLLEEDEDLKRIDKI